MKTGQYHFLLTFVIAVNVNFVELKLLSMEDDFYKARSLKHAIQSQPSLKLERDASYHPDIFPVHMRTPIQFRHRLSHHKRVGQSGLIRARGLRRPYQKRRHRPRRIFRVARNFEIMGANPRVMFRPKHPQYLSDKWDGQGFNKLDKSVQFTFKTKLRPALHKIHVDLFNSKSDLEKEAADSAITVPVISGNSHISTNGQAVSSRHGTTIAKFSLKPDVTETSLIEDTMRLNSSLPHVTRSSEVKLDAKRKPKIYMKERSKTSRRSLDFHELQENVVPFVIANKDNKEGPNVYLMVINVSTFILLFGLMVAIVVIRRRKTSCDAVSSLLPNLDKLMTNYGKKWPSYTLTSKFPFIKRTPQDPLDELKSSWSLTRLNQAPIECFSID